MKASIRDWVREKIFDRIETLIAGSFARMAETRLLRSQMQELYDLEQLAEELEADGKFGLAQTLRQRTTQIVEGAPADSANLIIEQLAGDEEIIQSAMRLPAPPVPGKLANDSDSGGARPKRRGRPPKEKKDGTEETP